MEGSSAETMTKPPQTPLYAAVNSGSAATLTPTCFIAESERTPAIDAPYATSTATFSFGAHSQYRLSLYCGRFSKISVLGVPGYAEQTLTPASYAPRAIASLPESNTGSMFHSAFLPFLPELWLILYHI